MGVETKRLILRQPNAADAESYTALHNSEFVLRYNAMNPTTPERMRERFSQENDRENTIVLENKETGELIGAIFLEEDDLRYGVQSKCLSYFVGESHSRRGYMKEALQAVIRVLFADDSLECLSARAFVPNTASRALLKSLGFTENGIIPRCVKGYGGMVYDDVIHTLFREDVHKE